MSRGNVCYQLTGSLSVNVAAEASSIQWVVYIFAIRFLVLIEQMFMRFFEIAVQKLFFMVLVMILFVHSVQAEENIRAAEVNHGVCRDEAKLASHIMAKRQKNIPLIELMGIAAGIEADAERGLLETYIEQAFDTPLYSSEEKVKDVVEVFGREIYLECRSALNKRFFRQQEQPSLSK